MSGRHKVVSGNGQNRLIDQRRTAPCLALLLDGRVPNDYTVIQIIPGKYGSKLLYENDIRHGPFDNLL